MNFFHKVTSASIWIDWSIAGGAFLVSFVVSTLFIRIAIPRIDPSALKNKHLPESSKGGPVFDMGSTGFWIGFFETFLIFVCVYEDQFGALAIIFGAKEFVRKEKISSNPSYYLLGTLVNFSVAIFFALLVR